VNNPVTFATRVGFHADRDVTVATNLTVTGRGQTVILSADSACAGAGSLRVTKQGSVRVVDSVLTEQAHDLDIMGPVHSGEVATHIVGCSGVNIAVGGNGQAVTGQMRVSREELQQFYSRNLTLSAVTASIFVYDTFVSDTNLVRDRITLLARDNIVFGGGSSAFKSLRAVANAVNISSDLKVTEGHLVLEAHRYHVFAGVAIQSES